MKQTIYFLKGLPASGKSTWAKDHVAKNPGCVRINKDDLRDMLHAGKWSKEKEKVIVDAESTLCLAALRSGQSVIIDSTNFAPQHQERYENIAKEHKVNFELQIFDTPVEICLDRNSKRANPVPDKVILEMYNRYLAPKETPGRVQDTTLPHAVGIDLDGTAAIMGDRDPYDASTCYNDTVNTPVQDVVLSYGGMLFFVSGREDKHRAETVRWIDQKFLTKYHMVPRPYLLYMRLTGDQRKDSIIKKEIYEREILPKYHVDFVLDDRLQVVKMLRHELGLTVFQVNDGLF